MPSRRVLFTGLAASGAGLVLGAAPAAARPLTGRGRLAVELCPRAGWGADETLRLHPDGTQRWPAEFAEPRLLTVHHSALPVDQDRTESIRAIYRLHAVQNGWGDVGYHLLIDPEGVVYEGRYSGTDGGAIFEAAPRPDRPVRSVTAAHVRGHNTGNIGICLLGDFTGGVPAPAARASLIRVLAALSRVCGLDPLGTAEQVAPAGGAPTRMPTISRHRDWSATGCPGTAFADTFDTVRFDTANLLAGT